jgi:Uma2 family endonuclease
MTQPYRNDVVGNDGLLARRNAVSSARRPPAPIFNWQRVLYPDIVVDRAGRPGKSYTAGAPVFLAEVLSPSTAEIDLGDKAAEYLHVPSLHAYIVLSQDEPKA